MCFESKYLSIEMIYLINNRDLTKKKNEHYFDIEFQNDTLNEIFHLSICKCHVSHNFIASTQNSQNDNILD